MKVLLMAYHRRLLSNIAPVAGELARRGHTADVLYYYWPQPDNVNPPILKGDGVSGFISCAWVNDPDGNRALLRDVICGAGYDAFLLGDDVQAPACYVREIVRALAAGSRVYVLQHGFMQSWDYLKDHLRADYFLCWGADGPGQVANDPRFLVTGNPRLDDYRAEDAEDAGYTLIIAWPNEVTEENVREWTASPGPFIIKLHPDDWHDASRFNSERVRILTGRQDTRELIRRASRVITGPSTCWMEAALYGKPITPWHWPEYVPGPTDAMLAKCLLRGGSAGRIVDLMEAHHAA